jgi:hypothetical protein
VLRSCLVTSLGLFLATAIGCQSSPDYPVDRLAFEPTLVGVWQLDSDDRPEKCLRAVVAVRPVKVLHGRVNPIERMAPPPQGITESSAYAIRLENVDTTSHWREGQPTTLEFEAYLVRTTTSMLLTGQVTYEQVARGAPFPFALPLHLFAKIAIKGDRVTITPPRESFGYGVVWLPMLDVGGDAPSLEPAENPINHGWMASTSIDRVLGYYDKADGIAEFWQRDPLRFVRVAGESQ